MSPNGKYDPDAAPLMDANEIRMEFHGLIHDAKVKGEDVVIIKDGEPIARFSPKKPDPDDINGRGPQVRPLPGGKPGSEIIDATQ